MALNTSERTLFLLLVELVLHLARQMSQRRLGGTAAPVAAKRYPASVQELHPPPYKNAAGSGPDCRAIVSFEDAAAALRAQGLMALNTSERTLLLLLVELVLHLARQMSQRRLGGTAAPVAAK